MQPQVDSVTIWLNVFIPMASVEALGTCFSGDDRGFSSNYDESRYRARSEVVTAGFLAGDPQTTEFHQIGESHRVDCADGTILESATADSSGLRFHGFAVGNTYPDPEGGVVDNPNELCANILYDGATHNPLLLSPDIDVNLFFTIDPVGRSVSVRGAVNSFPDYEAYVRVDGGPSVTLFTHPHSLDPVNGLPGGADQAVSGRASF